MIVKEGHVITIKGNTPESRGEIVVMTTTEKGTGTEIVIATEITEIRTEEDIGRGLPRGMTEFKKKKILITKFAEISKR